MITIFSDPHVGLNRKSHTTQESRKRLSEAVYKPIYELVLKHENVICAGDLFDKYSNPEDIVLQGASIVYNCHAVLAGNHDLSNRDDKTGSLELIEQMQEEVAIPLIEVGKAGYITDDSLPVAYIPHHSSQVLFDDAIDEWCREGDDVEALFLHCNLDNSMTDGSDISLNLTTEQAKRLLERADRLFIGHEHNPRTLHSDRIVMVGNTHPTSFSDISDKFIWHLEDGNLTSTQVWSMADGYREIEWTPELAIPDLTGVQFVDIKGTTDAAYGADLATFVVELWKSSSELLMVRNNVEVVSETATATRVDFSDLPSEIAKQVEGTDLQPLWEKYSSAEFAQD